VGILIPLLIPHVHSSKRKTAHSELYMTTRSSTVYCPQRKPLPKISFPPPILEERQESPVQQVRDPGSDNKHPCTGRGHFNKTGLDNTVYLNGWCTQAIRIMQRTWPHSQGCSMKSATQDMPKYPAIQHYNGHVIT